RCGLEPAWIRHNGEKREVIEERADAARLCFDLFRRGYRTVRIAHALADRGIELTGEGRAANATTVERLIVNRAVLGEKTLKLSKTKTHKAETVTLHRY